MNKDIINLRENILSALPLSMAKEYERMNQELNTDKEGYYYKKIKPIFDKVFGKDDKGKPIYRKYINVDNIKVDEEISEFLSKNGYSISEEEFNAGIIIKNKDTLSNKYSLEELQKKGQVLRIGRILNKKKAPQNLILKWDRISKEISNKKLIVISRHPYDIAGQSTDRAWQSCMTLPTDEQEAGGYCEYVDSGIKAGILIAYLISNTDKNINKPLARVLIKPFVSKDKSEIQFKVSTLYGTAGFEFKNAVQKWVNRNLNSRHIEVDENMRDLDLYLDTENIYDDNDNEINIIEYISTLKKLDFTLYGKGSYDNYTNFKFSKNSELYLKNSIQEILVNYDLYDTNSYDNDLYYDLIKNINFFSLYTINGNYKTVTLDYFTNIEEIEEKYNLDSDVKYEILEEIESYLISDEFLENEHLYFISHSSYSDINDDNIFIEYTLKPDYIIIPNIELGYNFKGGIFKGNERVIQILNTNLYDFIKVTGLDT